MSSSHLPLQQCRILADTAVDSSMPSRTLGLVVLRGPNIALISPTDGSAGQSVTMFLLTSKLTKSRDREPIPIDQETREPGQRAVWQYASKQINVQHALTTSTQDCQSGDYDNFILPIRALLPVSPFLFFLSSSSAFVTPCFLTSAWTALLATLRTLFSPRRTIAAFTNGVLWPALLHLIRSRSSFNCQLKFDTRLKLGSVADLDGLAVSCFTIANDLLQHFADFLVQHRCG